MTISNKQNEAIKKFIKVRDILHEKYCGKRSGKFKAYYLSYKKPMKFFLEHSVEEAIVILEKEAEYYD